MTERMEALLVGLVNGAHLVDIRPFILNRMMIGAARGLMVFLFCHGRSSGAVLIATIT